MLRAVIFDMDGTLLDSEVIHYIVINDILKRELGWEQTPEEYLKYCGIPDQKMWPMMMDEMDSGNVMSLARKWGMASDEVLPSVEDSRVKPQGNIEEESRRLSAMATNVLNLSKIESLTILEENCFLILMHYKLSCIIKILQMMLPYESCVITFIFDNLR